jgi:hypothetical protein
VQDVLVDEDRQAAESEGIIDLATYQEKASRGEA